MDNEPEPIIEPEPEPEMTETPAEEIVPIVGTSNVVINFNDVFTEDEQHQLALRLTRQTLFPQGEP